MTLSIVATPIGNLEDITLRAIRVLREADAILAEDTRRTRVLCRHHAITTPVRSFHAHSPEALVDALVQELRIGKHLALVTDAGTPLVSDPGARLVSAAAEAGIAVQPLPGPSAVLGALAAAGLRVSEFRFVGFLPRSGKRRRLALSRIAAAPEATVMFESPRRLPATLRDLRDAAGEGRRAVVARELTKLHEEVVRGTLGTLSGRFEAPPRGEITLVIEGADEAEPATDDPERARRRARELLAAGAHTKEAARRLSAELGIGAREAYALMLELSRQG